MGLARCRASSRGSRTEWRLGARLSQELPVTLCDRDRVTAACKEPLRRSAATMRGSLAARLSSNSPTFANGRSSRHVSALTFELTWVRTWAWRGVASGRRCALPCSGRGALWGSAGHVDELELDVVGIPEDDHRVGHRLVGVDDAGVLDAEFVEPACPCVQIGAINDAE